MDPHCQKVCVHSYPDIHSYFPSLSLLISYYISPSHLTLEPQNYLPDPKPLLLAHAPWFFLYYSLCPNCPFHVPPPFPLQVCCLKKISWIIIFSFGEHLWSFSLPILQGELATPLYSNAPHRRLNHINNSTLWHMLNCVFSITRLWTPLVKNPLWFIDIEIILSIVLI